VQTWSEKAFVQLFTKFVLALQPAFRGDAISLAEHLSMPRVRSMLTSYTVKVCTPPKSFAKPSLFFFWIPNPVLLPTY